jgi:hypothetical protein
VKGQVLASVTIQIRNEKSHRRQSGWAQCRLSVCVTIRFLWTREGKGEGGNSGAKGQTSDGKGVLLGASSDSHRMTTMLRDENGELRRAVVELRKEVGKLRVQLAKVGVSTNRAGTWTARRSGLSTSISSTNMNQTDEKWGTSMKGKAIHSRGDQRSSFRN